MSYEEKNIRIRVKNSTQSYKTRNAAREQNFDTEIKDSFSVHLFGIDYSPLWEEKPEKIKSYENHEVVEVFTLPFTS